MELTFATYIGPLTRIGEAWRAVGAHLAAEGLDPAGVCREIYHRTQAEDPTAEWEVELQQPVRL